MAQNVEVGLTSRAEKTLRQRNKWRQRFDRGTLMASLKFHNRILYLNLFGQTFSREFIKSLFFTNIENKDRKFHSYCHRLFSLRILYNSLDSI